MGFLICLLVIIIIIIIETLIRVHSVECMPLLKLNFVLNKDNQEVCIVEQQVAINKINIIKIKKI